MSTKSSSNSGPKKKALKIAAVLPARMGSSRFPGKPLYKILGTPMIEHVYRRTVLCKSLQEVYVATCDREIQKAVEGFGGRAIMTSPRHNTATERVAEAAKQIDADVILMVQGDEPLILPEMIEMALKPFSSDPEIRCVNLAKRILDETEYRDLNTIKVVMDNAGDALFFSRSPIPVLRGLSLQEIRAYKQVCVIPFRKDALLEYTALPSTPLEKAESIDMIRFLEHGHKVRMVETSFDSHAVDVLADIAVVEEKMQKSASNSLLLKRT